MQAKKQRVENPERCKATNFLEAPTTPPSGPAARRWRWAQERGLPTWANFVPFAIEHQQQLIPHCTPSSRTHLKGGGREQCSLPAKREGGRAAIERGSPPLTLACRPRLRRLRDRCGGGGGLAHCARLQAGCYLKPHEALEADFERP